jgi:hypothetical protein
MKACTIEKDEIVFIVEMVNFTMSFVHGTYDLEGSGRGCQMPL